MDVLLSPTSPYPAESVSSLSSSDGASVVNAADDQEDTEPLSEAYKLRNKQKFSSAPNLQQHAHMTQASSMATLVEEGSAGSVSHPARPRLGSKRSDNILGKKVDTLDKKLLRKKSLDGSSSSLPSLGSPTKESQSGKIFVFLFPSPVFAQGLLATYFKYSDKKHCLVGYSGETTSLRVVRLNLIDDRDADDSVLEIAYNSTVSLVQIFFLLFQIQLRFVDHDPSFVRLLTFIWSEHALLHKKWHDARNSRKVSW
jgi:hypothetical protein